MKITELGIEEIARFGFTHKAILSFAQGDFSAAALTQTYNLGAVVPIGTIVDAAAMRLVTVIAGGAIASATVSLGYTGTVAGFAAAANVWTGATVGPIMGGGSDLISANNAKAFTAATQLVAVLTTTTGNVVAATAGEVHLFWRQKDLTKI